MACLTPVTIRIDTPTGPLNSAVFEPTRNKIFAVRDNWIYQLNATTGAKEAESRFAYPGVGGDTYIDYDTTTDMLWMTYWRSTEDINTNHNSVKYLASIDPDDISAVTLYPLTGGMLPTAFDQWCDGPGQIITRNGIGWFLYAGPATAFRTQIARVNLAGPTITTTGSISGGSASTWTSIFHDGTNLIVGSNGDEDAKQINAATLAGITVTGEGTLIFPYGITSPGGSFAYFATATKDVVKAEIGGAFASSIIDLGQANANPHNIRYATALNLIYVPLYKDDTVAVLNPLDDSFVIKTGFTQPWDVVTTASKAFALQHAAIGIKEIV